MGIYTCKDVKAQGVLWMLINEDELDFIPKLP